MKRRFAGKVVVVTGASSGVGRAVARAFGGEGAKVGLIARTGEALDNCVREIEALGGQALALPTDVSDAAAVEKAAATVETRWGQIHIWINDAMVSVFSPVKEMLPEEYERVTQVNYLGAVYGTLAALKRMIVRDEGYILQIGSALAYCSIPLQSAYCASKAAMRGFTDSLRIELRHDKSAVTVGMLQLPAVNTPQFDVVRSRLPNHPMPVPPIYQPEVIADAVLYACAQRSRELWLGTSAIKAILGQFFARRLTEWYLARGGYTSQQTTSLPPKQAADDVFHLIPGDKGAQGKFEAQARSFNTEIWMRTHPAFAVTASVLLFAGVMLGAASARR